MMKKLLTGAALAAAVLTSTHLLADPEGQRHSQNATCSGANCPAATAAEQHGHHGMGHAAGGEHHAHGRRGDHAGHGAARGHMGEGCPMHGTRTQT